MFQTRRLGTEEFLAFARSLAEQSPTLFKILYGSSPQGLSDGLNESPRFQTDNFCSNLLNEEIPKKRKCLNDATSSVNEWSIAAQAARVLMDLMSDPPDACHNVERGPSPTPPNLPNVRSETQPLLHAASDVILPSIHKLLDNKNTNGNPSSPSAPAALSDGLVAQKPVAAGIDPAQTAALRHTGAQPAAPAQVADGSSALPRPTSPVAFAAAAAAATCVRVAPAAPPLSTAGPPPEAAAGGVDSAHNKYCHFCQHIKVPAARRLRLAARASPRRRAASGFRKI